MGKDSKIQWTHHTFNPWWGCARVSAGCENCYAERDANRFGVKWGVKAERRFFGDGHWAEPIKWNAKAAAAGERRRVFCASYADVMENRRDLDRHRDRLWQLIQDTPHLDWLLLTKRPEMFRTLLPREIARRNVWLGVTTEDQARLEERVPFLLEQEAAVRFLSAEPLLGPIFPRAIGSGSLGNTWDCLGSRGGDLGRGVDWVILGFESGPGARIGVSRWIADVVADCRAAGVAPFVKQLGRQHRVGYDQGALVTLNDRKGGNIDEWPAHLRVREFPEVRP